MQRALWFATVLVTGLWLASPCDGIEVHSVYSRVNRDEGNLHRNIISLNLLPQRLSIDKVALLETKLKLQLATKLWSPEAQSISVEELALYIQALRASCADPSDFYGVNLVQMMANLTSQPDKHNVTSFEDHLVSLTLCLLSRNASHFTSLLGSEKLAQLLHRQDARIGSLQNHHSYAAQRRAENALLDQKSTNDRLMKSLVVSCYAKLVPDDRDIRFELNDLMANVFLKQNQTDGSFNGSVITTSLAIQAFAEAGLDRLSFLWDRRKAVNFINTSMRDADISSTLAYYLVPVFHRTWREIQCKNGSRSEENDEREAEYARSWTRTLNQVLNQADSSVNVTVSRWIYGSSGEKTKVSVNIPPEGSLLRALKEAVKSTTTYHYSQAFAGLTNQTARLSDPQPVAPTTTTHPNAGATSKPWKKIAKWFRSLNGQLA